MPPDGASKDTYTVCNHGQAFTSWMMSKQGSICTTTGVPVIEGDGQAVFQENCLSKQPQGGAAHMHMTVHLAVTDAGVLFSLPSRGREMRMAMTFQSTTR
ncbi:hypothetical protein A6M27_14540 [Acidithiobacillus thiooxidans]|uniref:Uncharacterized protein n=1 Tax=Acidithiobacillus thiooxidans TaxID=930 RepID=A0A1C2J092_ACITH|nr:hypothetical protein A6P07_00440 [Acidithiobacillus thiooxidans]OCX80076.1 hypothetical protein A6O24_00180 [Acidithiobacillus thiooxidans]OCX81622.1 hypothetical protein A6O26_12565 [Acidithiobacillus thiooxidans]OCX85831.1 hypothetical protein A6M27_14540 [Acidithiobacillus thiooxidans]OFC48672.1 hypothetical protein BAE47_06990 [Acidithiobacillus thiooxidans]